MRLDLGAVDTNGKFEGGRLMINADDTVTVLEEMLEN